MVWIRYSRFPVSVWHFGGSRIYPLDHEIIFVNLRHREGNLLAQKELGKVPDSSATFGYRA